MAIRVTRKHIALTARTLAAASAAFLFGCEHVLPPATAAVTTLPAAKPGEALLVFVRPTSTCDTGDYSVVVDDHGKFVANITPGTQVALSVTPGPHVFYAWNSIDLRIEREPTYNPVAAVSVTATPSETDYVGLEVYRPRFDCMENAIVDLVEVNRRSPLWGDLQGWLSHTSPVAADLQAGQAALEAKPALLASYLDLGRAKMVRESQMAAVERRRKALRAEP